MPDARFNRVTIFSIIDTPCPPEQPRTSSHANSSRELLPQHALEYLARRVARQVRPHDQLLRNFETRKAGATMFHQPVVVEAMAGIEHHDRDRTFTPLFIG